MDKAQKESLNKEALKYDLNSLIKLQEKRRENISLFEQSIKGERSASQQEEVAQASLEEKLRYHDLGISKLTDAEKEWILSDLPKLKSTKEKRNQTIMLLKAAILQEQEQMDREEYMIHFLEKRNGSKE
jgi:hypothetical protein